MSKAVLRITTQAKDGGQSNYGAVELDLTINGRVYPLNLALSPSSGYGKFQEVLWFSPTASADYAQSQSYALAAKRDFKSTGGPKNVVARIIGATVEIEAVVGTFSGGNYTGNILSSVTFTYDNSVQSVPKTFSFTATGNGSCTTEEYRVQAATGGTAPYRLTFGGVNVVENWDGNQDVDFDLLRAGIYSGGLYDSNDELIKSAQINPTKNIAASDFKQRVIPYVGYSDLLIETVVPRNGTDPLEYNLINSEAEETGWQTSNTFAGVAQGTYTVKIRDRYLCETSRTFPVAEITSILEENREPYFEISEFNSLAYFKEVKHSDTIRKNYDNTPSWCENVALPKNGIFKFPGTSQLPQQFRSSFSHHKVTLIRRNAPAVQLQFFEIQSNLGSAERVDCKLFPLLTPRNPLSENSFKIPDGTGVYFEGGNQYEPGSNVVKTDPSSPYVSGLPPWAQKGNVVNIIGVGSFEITDTELYDSDRDVLYFKISENIAASVGNVPTDAIVEGSWDRHPYNVFRFNVDMSTVFDEGAFVRIEPGVLSGAEFLVDLTRIRRSEFFARIEDTSKYLKVEWSAFRNIGLMLFTDGIKCEMWLKGRMRPFSETDAKSDDADDRTNSLDQSAYLRMRGFFPVLTPKQWRKLDLVGSIGNRGRVLIENMELVRINSAEQEELGDTNASNYSVEFAFNGESTAVGQEDPVYSVDTGLPVNPGTSGKTGREPVEDWQVGVGENRLATTEGDWVKVVDTDGVEKYVIIT